MTKVRLTITLLASAVALLFIIGNNISLFAMNSTQDLKKPNAKKHYNSWASLNEAQKNNLRTLDLTDLKNDLPLHVVQTKQILWKTEKWEKSTWNTSKDIDTLGYPTVVKNIFGPRPDNKYYLFYAHHDPPSGIGCAVASSIEGPYIKLKEINPNMIDSQVLQSSSGKKNDPRHYSSPCVLWNEDEQVWFMYFHFFKDEWGKGNGHQKTGLAICADLRENIWKIWADKEGNPIAVLPTTSEKWMNSQSSYHAIQRLPDGRWLAFLRGTGGEYNENRQWVQDPCKLGFAISADGRHWDYFPENPIIHQADGKGGKAGVYRPHFIGYLGNKEYLVAWSESDYYDKNSKIIYGCTSDFKSIKRDKRGYANWPASDGLISPFREGNRLFLFSGKYLHIMELPI